MRWSHKRVRSIALASGTLVIVGLASSACGTSGQHTGHAKTPSASHLTTLTIGEQPYNGLAATELGQKVGIFAHYGLRIKLAPASSIAVITAEVHSGQVPIGYTVLAILANAAEKGLGVRCIAPVESKPEPISGYPENAIIVAKNSPITSMKQLDGKTLGLVALKGPDYLTAKQFVTQAGGNWSSVKPATVPFADMPAAVSSGEVTAAEEVSPYIEKGVASGKVKVLQDLSANNEGLIRECYMASNSYIASHKSLIDRFVKAQDQSILFAAAHPAKANAEIPTVAGIPASALKGTLPPKVDYSDTLQLASISKYEQWMKKWGGLLGPILPASKLAYVPAGTPMKTLLFNSKGKYIGKSASAS